MQELFQQIDRLQGDYLKFWTDICNIEGISSDKPAVNRVADRIEAFCMERGFSVSRHPFEKAGDYLTVDMNEESSEKGYLFLAHMDTVHEKGKFGNPAVHQAGGKLYGPGVIDCKGGIAVALLAMQALRETGEKRHMRLLLTSDEEVSEVLSGEEGIRLIQKMAEEFQGAFCCEVGKKGKITVGRKGILKVRFDITGRASHAGIAYFEGCSAIREAAYKILALEQRSEDGGITYNCGRIGGGEVPNIVPQNCSFLLDVRFVTEKDMKCARDTVYAVAEKSYMKDTVTKLTLLSKRVPMQRTAENEKLFERIRRVCEQYGLEEVSMTESGGGSDAAYTVAIGIPSVCSVGTTGDCCHTKEEYAEIDSLARRAKMLGAVIREET